MTNQSLPVPDASLLPEPFLVLDVIINAVHQSLSMIYGLDKVVLSVNETGKGIWNTINALSGFQPPKV